LVAQLEDDADRIRSKELSSNDRSPRGRRSVIPSSDRGGLGATMGQSIIEAAYVLARTGRFENLEAIKRRLVADGWSTQFGRLDPEGLRKDIECQCRRARLKRRAA
jgi:hypothetical protein